MNGFLQTLPTENKTVFTTQSLSSELAPRWSSGSHQMLIVGRLFKYSLITKYSFSKKYNFFALKFVCSSMFGSTLFGHILVIIIA